MLHCEVVRPYTRLPYLRLIPALSFRASAHTGVAIRVPAPASSVVIARSEATWQSVLFCLRRVTVGRSPKSDQKVCLKPPLSPGVSRGKFKSWPTATPLPTNGGRGDAGRGRVPSEARLRAVGRDAATTGGHTATGADTAPRTGERATHYATRRRRHLPPRQIQGGGGESKGATPASDRAGAPRRWRRGRRRTK